MKAKAVVFDLWYTLVCPEDHGPLADGEIGAISTLLGLDPEAFGAFWTVCREEKERTPRPVAEYVNDYLSSHGRALTDGERAALDAIWTPWDRALTLPSPNVVDALKDLVHQGLRRGCVFVRCLRWPN